MHALLRINKFNQIPQPSKFFEYIYYQYFKNNNGFVIHAYDLENNLIAGILFIISGDAAFYKFSASYLESLKYRPNNLLMDRLIKYCDERAINKLNLGYTGLSEGYEGLRQYKLHAGAKEYPRYLLKTDSFSNLKMDIISQINIKVSELIKAETSLDKIDQFSTENYKYFI